MNGYFSIEKNGDCVNFYSLRNMPNLSSGEVFIKKCGKKIQIHPKYQLYEKIINLMDNFSESENYKFSDYFK
jgi:hypothetical protein